MSLNNKKSIKIFLNSVAFLFAVVLIVAVLPSKALAAGPRFSNIAIEGIEGYRLRPFTSHHISGTVSSGTGYNLNYVEAAVYSRSTGKRVTCSGIYGIGKGSFSIKSSQVDNGLKFANLAPGQYDLKITAADTKGNTSSKTLYFYIESDLIMRNLSVSNKVMKQGCAYNIYGTISSDYKITRVRAVIQHFIGQEGKYKDTNQVVENYRPNAKSVNIVDTPINKDLKFGALPADSKYMYRVKIQAWDDSGMTITRYIENIWILK